MDTITPATTFALITLGLFLKHFATTTVQVRTRLKTRLFPHPEDAVFWKGEVGDHPTAELAQGVLGNDMENVPIFLFLLAAFLGLEGSPIIGLVYGVIFTGARFGHLWAFINTRQPLRNRMFLVGLSMTFALVVHAAILLISKF